MAKLKTKVSDLIYHDTFCNLYTGCFDDVQDNYTWKQGQRLPSAVLLWTSIVWSRILVQDTIYRRLRIGRDGHLAQSKAYDIS